jgi:hypothetical protein
LKLCVQTLFLPRESIFYMEEWLLYHTLLGFDKFKLYDNTGSEGDISSPYRIKYGKSRTKYGLPLVSEEHTDEEIREAARKICLKFEAELVPWPSKNYTNEVQMSAVMDHSARDDSDYTAFIDMDEYICVAGCDIKDFIRKEVEGKGHCGVRMSQQKMPHILKAKLSGLRVWELRDTFRMETRGWAPKNILPTSGVVSGTNIHDISCHGDLLDQPDRRLIKINHYNTNEYQMWWLAKNHMIYDHNTPLEQIYLGQSQDESLAPFSEKMKNWDYLNLEEI